MDTGKIMMLRFKRLVFCDIDEEWGGFGDASFVQDFPHQVDVSTSTLPICKSLLEKPGWNYEELWEMGKRYAAATGQVPSKLQIFLKKLTQQWKAL